MNEEFNEVFRHNGELVFQWGRIFGDGVNATGLTEADDYTAQQMLSLALLVRHHHTALFSLSARLHTRLLTICIAPHPTAVSALCFQYEFVAHAC